MWSTLALFRTHYDTLNVPNDADVDTIKKAFRKLSLETHPDVSGPQSCPKRFQAISEAASVLTNPRKKEVYDMQIQHSRPFSQSRQKGTRVGGLHAQSGFQEFMLQVFRPRNIIIGFCLVFTVNTIASGFNDSEKPDDESLVQAWKNPKTGNWEQPSPWDPTYQLMKPRLEYVPRDQVKARNIR